MADREVKAMQITHVEILAQVTYAKFADNGEAAVATENAFRTFVMECKMPVPEN
jgi:hypothetical protein